MRLSQESSKKVEKVEPPKKAEKVEKVAQNPDEGSYGTGAWVLVAAGILTAGIIAYRTVAKK